MKSMTYAQAALVALQQEMRRDPRVWALGEDLGPEGGVAGQYLGLQAEFGDERVLDTPISENAIVGAAVGAALVGTRPVVELRFADFGLCAADELVNQAAKIRYMFGGQARVPLVVRQAIGMRNGMAAQHSQSTEAWWIHVPGLVVVTPATPADNHALLKAAIRCDDPVVYLEHKDLWASSGPVDVDAPPAELGRARLVHAGGDITIVSWSKCVLIAAEAVAALATEGVSAELLDLRTLWPWDRDAVFTSVAKTGRLLVVHEAVRVNGFGAEIVAEASEALFGVLRRAPRRLAGARVPIPYSKPLEERCRISAEDIAATVREMLG